MQAENAKKKRRRPAKKRMSVHGPSVKSSEYSNHNVIELVLAI